MNRVDINIGDSVELNDNASDDRGIIIKYRKGAVYLVTELNEDMCLIKRGTEVIKVYINYVIKIIDNVSVTTVENGKAYKNPNVVGIGVNYYGSKDIKSNMYCNGLFKNIEDGLWYYSI